MVSIGNHEKCIFQHPHNEMKCVLYIKESYSNTFTFAYSQAGVVTPPPPYGQPDRKILVFFFTASL